MVFGWMWGLTENVELSFMNSAGPGLLFRERNYCVWRESLRRVS